MSIAPTILIVEDHREVSAYLERRMHAAVPGARILRAESGEAALDLVRSEPLDLIVSDFRLPGMDGVTFLHHALEIAPDVPRILLTGYGDSGVATRAVNESHVQAYFEKPAVSESFERVTKKLMEEHRAQRGDST